MTAWTFDEHKRLEDLASEGRTASYIAEDLKRSKNSVRERARRYGISLALSNESSVRKQIDGVMHRQCTASACRKFKPENLDNFYWNADREAWEGKCKACRNKQKAEATRKRLKIFRLQERPHFTATPGLYSYFWNVYGYALTDGGSEIHPVALKAEAA